MLAFSDFGNRNHICRISWIYYNSHIHFFGTWVWPAHTNQCSRPRFSLFSTGLHLKPLQVWPPNGKLRKDSSQSSCYLFFGPDAERIGVCFFFGSNRSCKSVSYIPHQTISRWLKDPPLKLLSGGHCLRGGASGPLSKVPAKAEELLMDWFKRDRALGEATGRVWFMQALSLLVADDGFKKKKAWFFRFKKRMGTLYDMSVSAHKPVGNKFLSMGDDAVVQMVENYWKNLCGARHSYNLHDPDSIILGDEMGFPYESLPKYIYDNSWSCGKPVGEVLWEGKTSSQFSFFYWRLS